MHILKNTIEVKAFQKGSRQQKFAQKGAVLKQKNPKPQTWWEMYFEAEALSKKY